MHLNMQMILTESVKHLIELFWPLLKNIAVASTIPMYAQNNSELILVFHLKWEELASSVAMNQSQPR